MYSSSFQPPSSRGGLPHHLGRLRLALEALLARLRGSVADAFGRTAADALGEAVQVALGGSATTPTYLTVSPSSRPGRSFFDERDEPPWSRPGSSLGRGERLYDERFDRDDPYERRFDDDEPEPDELPDEQQGAREEARWRALAIGLQAAAWWWARRPGRTSVLAALAVGLAAGLATLGGSAALGTAAVVTSGLALLYLADLIHWIASLFGSV
jgi:hypothetical protein